MNCIFWENKGHTRKLALENIWPTTEICSTPKEFLAGKELILLINPKKLESKYFMANFWCFDATSSKFVEFNDRLGNPIVSCQITKDIFYAEYIRKALRINTSAFLADKDESLVGYFNKMHTALQLLENAVRLFDETFPVQKYIYPEFNEIPDNT